MLKRILPNLGFVLQFSGILILIPAFLGMLWQEESCSVAFFLTSSLFLALGFLLNIFSERVGLNLKEAFVLLLLSFLCLGLIGTIPFLYLEVFGKFSLASLVNSFFESVSGFTTTGFTLLKNVEVLPKSFIVYRSLTQFIGGLGIVYISLSFVYSDHPRVLKRIGKIFEIKEKKNELKSFFFGILSIYAILLLISSIFSFFYFRDFFTSLAFSLSAISTGGFLPVKEINPSPFALFLCIPMFFGAVNFALYVKLSKAEEKIKQSFFLFILLIFLLFVFLFSSWKDITKAIFYSISVTTTSGFRLGDVNLTSSEELLFIGFMLIGGMSFSTAGGIKVERFLCILRSVPKILRKKIMGEDISIDEYPFILFFLYIFTVFITALLISSYGFAFDDSLLLSSSALTTTGIASQKIFYLPTELRLLLSLVMILGRVEISPLLLLFIRRGSAQ